MTLVVYYPDMASDSAEKLRVLASLAATTADGDGARDQPPMPGSGALPGRQP